MRASSSASRSRLTRRRYKLFLQMVELLSAPSLQVVVDRKSLSEINYSCISTIEIDKIWFAPRLWSANVLRRLKLARRFLVIRRRGQRRPEEIYFFVAGGKPREGFSASLISASRVSPQKETAPEGRLDPEEFETLDRIIESCDRRLYLRYLHIRRLHSRNRHHHPGKPEHFCARWPFSMAIIRTLSILI